MARRPRKQRVVLRSRRRVAIHSTARKVMLRGLAGALAVGFALGLVTKSDSLFSRFFDRHTPQVNVSAPALLQGLTIDSTLPLHRFWLWFPGSAARVERRVLRQNPGVGAIHVRRDFRANIVNIQLVPRMPLVRLAGHGIDAEGMIFPIADDAWPQLPKVILASRIPSAILGHWLLQMSKQSELWGQVALLSTDAQGSMLLQLRNGMSVLWGTPESRSVGPKAASLSRVTEDAHEHLGGASTVDLRFFEDGRIIVRPKGI